MILRTFRPFRPDDLESLVGLTVRAFEPVQDAIRHQLGDELFDRQNGQWEQDYRDAEGSAGGARGLSAPAVAGPSLLPAPDTAPGTDPGASHQRKEPPAPAYHGG